jgi:hypothetical protein
MPSASERRTRSERRKAPRGGRRPYDQPGTTPLVLVVGNGSDPQQESETILHELKFAVAPAAGIADALRVVESLHPDLIVARPEEASGLRASGSVTVPIVEYSGQGQAGNALVDLLRAAIRSHR